MTAMSTAAGMSVKERPFVESRLTYHLRCLREDATDPELTSLERLALVRDRAGRIQEIPRKMETAAPIKPDDGR